MRRMRSIGKKKDGRDVNGRGDSKEQDIREKRCDQGRKENERK